MKLNKTISIFLAAVVLFNPLGSRINCAPETQKTPESADGKISLDLKNVEIVELLRIISLKTGKTIVPSKEITGRITVYLSNVAFNDVLDIILLTQGLALNHRGNVYYVMSEAEYRRIFGRDYVDPRKIQTVKLVYAKPAAIFTALGQLKSDVGKIVVDESSGTIILIDIPDKLELLAKTVKELDRPLTTTVYDLNYIKAADAKTQLTAAVTQGTGEVIIDERSGKAIISDLPQKMQKMSMLVRELDEKSRQVYVEADIVELSLSDEFERGIDWQKVFTAAEADGLTFAGYFPAALTAAYQKISVGTLATDRYSAILKFLATYGKTNIISQPRIAVVNNEEANIMVGVREAYITQTQSQATSTTVTSETVEFVDVGVKLKVVPKIGADGFITMKLKPEVSSVKETITTALGSRIPIVQTSQSETVVKVKDGTMIMIAGMTKFESTDSITGWPMVSKIPILGALFGYRHNTKDRTEVIIFLTPHLSSGDVGLRGSAISKIIPMEHLPENLQDKVTRDEKIDKTMFDSELTPEDKAAMATERKTARMVARNEKTSAAQEKAKRIVEEAKEQAADKATDKAAQQVIKEASLKAEGILNPESDNASTLKETLSPAQILESAKEYYQKGLHARSESDNIEAKNYFNKAIELDNKFAAAYNSLGILYEEEGKLRQAEEAYLKATEADPKFIAVYSNLALFYEDRGNFEKAVTYWRKRALYGDPNDEWTKKAIQRIKELENNS
ncbi:MAG: secretin N-terminal domain-containing protein [Candidatus Omnitrophica bacterium]|nr:secretin N-terminal domain-containing protein [Candidatus Omnitrophota bacterium]